MKVHDLFQLAYLTMNEERIGYPKIDNRKSFLANFDLYFVCCSTCNRAYNCPYSVHDNILYDDNDQFIHIECFRHIRAYIGKKQWRLISDSYHHNLTDSYLGLLTGVVHEDY